jgi:hypothetical protein
MKSFQSVFPQKVIDDEGHAKLVGGISPREYVYTSALAAVIQAFPKAPTDDWVTMAMEVADRSIEALNKGKERKR